MEKAERYLKRTARVYHSEPAYRCRSERSPGHLEITQRVERLLSRRKTKVKTQRLEPLDDECRLSFLRLTGESARAYAAYKTYRDLGPQRSLTVAWQQNQAAKGRQGRPKKCCGQWQRWSVKWNWVERAVNYDAYLDAEECTARVENRKKCEDMRGKFEFNNQSRLEGQILMWQDVLEKLALCPVTDFYLEKLENGKIVKTKIKGIDFNGAARMLHEINEALKLAILDPRELEQRRAGTFKTERALDVKGIVWMEADYTSPARISPRLEALPAVPNPGYDNGKMRSMRPRAA